jgi:endonuclease/exonuclease/phosphatase family metal-dependent hydrolase
MAFDPLEPYGPLIETRARIVTWNVFANAGPWEARFARIEQLLRGMDADIVGMQEVWRAAGHDPAAVIADKLGVHYTPCIEWFEPAALESGTAVLSRWPVSESGSRKLAGFDGGDGGLVQFARVDGPRGQIDVFVVMLDWRPDLSHVRQAQVRELAAYVNETGSAGHPVVILGDFNAGPETDEMRMLIGQSQVAAPGLVFWDAWDVASEGGPGHTWSRRNRYAAAGLLPDRRIDYVLSAWPRARGAGHPVRCEVLGAPGLDGVDPSDHFAVMAEIRY